MSQIDAGEGVLSEGTAGYSDDDNLKLVPVTESIRYRKRAQSAEKKAEILAEQLARAKSEADKMAEQLSDIQVEQKLVRKLAASGAADLETAVLVANARMRDSDEADLDSVVEQLKKEKQYLFCGERGPDKIGVMQGIPYGTTQKTAGPKDRETGEQTILERAAKKAAMTGNRTDLHEYLRLRRNFI